MQAIVDALQEQQEELAELLAELDAEDGARPSACSGWTVADVVLHLAQTNELAIASARDRFGEVMARLYAYLPPAADIDDGAAELVARDRHRPWSEIHLRWIRSCVDLRAALLARHPADRVEWVLGQMAARTLATTRLAETWIHAGDIAHGLGVTLEPTDRIWHIARLAWRTIPHAFERAGSPPPGPVAFDLVAPSGAAWAFGDPGAATVIRGTGHDLCRVASRRVAASDTTLIGEGPDAEAVLALARTWA